MYIQFDKTHALFERLADYRNCVDKVKAIAIGMIATDLTPTSYYATDLQHKMCAHFLLDSTAVVKYTYSTTNVFDNGFEPIIWRKAAWNLVEDTKNVTLAKPVNLRYIQTTPDYLIKGTENRRGIKRTVKGVTIHVATSMSSTALQERQYLENATRENPQYAWHVCVDNINAIVAVPYDEIANHSAYGDLDTIGVMICRGGTQKISIARAAQLVANILEDYGLTIEQVYRHKDWQPEKDCTAAVFDENSWQAFLKAVQNYLEPSPVNTSDLNVRENVKGVPCQAKYYNPGNHIIYVLVLNNLPKEDYYLIEDKLIRFLGDYLITHDVTPDILCRLDDVIESPMNCFPSYYSNLNDWAALLDSISKYITDSRQSLYHVGVTYTGVPMKYHKGFDSSKYPDIETMED